MGHARIVGVRRLQQDPSNHHIQQGYRLQSAAVNGMRTRQTLARVSRQIMPEMPVKHRARWVRAMLILGEKYLCHPARFVRRKP